MPRATHSAKLTEMDSRFTSSTALAVSLAAHVLVFGVGSLAKGVASWPARDRACEDVVELEALPGESSQTGVGLREVDPVRVVVASLSDEPWEGVTVVAHPDFGPGARGGTDRASEAAHNLTTSNDAITLSRNILDSAVMDQVSRVESGRTRSSSEDRTALRDPGDAAWSADAPVRSRGRFESADTESARAQLGAMREVVRGTAPALRGASAAFPPLDERPRSGTDREARRASDRAAQTSRRAAPASGGVPLASRDRASVIADARGETADVVNSAEQVQSPTQALLHASTAGGATGAGPGGESGALRPASGGVGSFGSRARASGGGSGFGLDVRLDGYRRRLQGSVHFPEFPRWAVAQGRGGVAIVGLTILANGSLAEVHLVRSSGVLEFDHDVVQAIRHAAPFEPLPPSLGHALAIRYTFDATNPAVGRDGSGPGGRSE